MSQEDGAEGEEDVSDEEHLDQTPSRSSIPKAIQIQLDEDDAKIAALEKKLGKRKAIEDDGLDDLLGGFESDDSGLSKKRRAEYDDYLESKRLRRDRPVDTTVHSDTDDSEGSEFGGLSDSDAPAPSVARVREDPYKPPVAPESAKYVPPSLRTSVEASSALSRRIKGLINRLGESNLLPVVRDIQGVYSSNPRQVVTSTVIDAILAAVHDHSSLSETFIILHAGFTAGIYRLVGVEFGAHLVERIVAAFDEDDEESKRTLNLMSFVSHLYSLHVVGSVLVYDFMRIFLSRLSERDTELLLRIVKSCGPQLRHEDPTSLKDVVQELNRQVARIGATNLSVRTKFMVETIGDLKNNRMKTGQGTASIAAEHLTRIKRTLGELAAQQVRASEPLRMGLDDVRNADKKGKWWLVGASWKGAGPDTPNTAESEGSPTGPSEQSDLQDLAQRMRMNTDVRRAIFQAIMSAEDYRDARVRLQKLRLKKSQELEIPRIVVQCAVSEASYNPYYTLIARTLSGEHRFRKAFQFVCWDYVKRMEPSDDIEPLSLRELVHLGKMYGSLIGRGDEPITTLKNVDFAVLSSQARTFVEITLITALMEVGEAYPESKRAAVVRKRFSKAHDAPEMVTGVRHILRTGVIGSDLIPSGQNKMVRTLARVAMQVLTGTESES